MPDRIACPPPEVLAELASGRLPPASSRELESHLAECPTCVGTLDELRSGETFVGERRPVLPQPIPLAEAVDDTLSPQPPIPLAEAVDATMLPSPEEELAARLSPPSGPGEVGRLAGYAVLGVLGTGGMGVVYRAIDTQLGRMVALKTIKPSMVTAASRERFFREARAAAKLDHDHIVGIYQVGEANGVPFLAMPLLKGEPLDERLNREGRLPVAEAVRIAPETAKGLAAAHEAGLVHRDIKPGNLWLEERPGEPPRVRILDFGLARGTGDVQLTHSGAIVGTPAYMAPEQATGKTVDGRADLFSVGCTLYQMLTDDRPFRGVDLMGTLMALATETPMSVSVLNTEVPSELATVVEILLAKKPEGRYASARDLLKALDTLGQPGAPEVRKFTPPPVKKRKRWPMVAGLLLAMAAAFAAAAVVRITGDKGEVVIEADKDVKVTLKQGGKTVRVVDTKSGRTFDISAGEYEAEVRESPDGVVVATKKFTIVRGGKEVLSVKFEPKAEAAGTAIPAAERVEGMPAELVADLGSSRMQTWVTRFGDTFVRFSPDGRFVLAYGDAPKVVMWRTDTFERVAEFERSGATAAVFSPDGKTLAMKEPRNVSLPGVRLWDVSGDKPVKSDVILAGQAAYPVAWTPDGEALFATANPGNPEKSVVWRRGENAPVTELPPMPTINWGGISRDGKLVVTQDNRTSRMPGFVAWDIGGDKPKEVATADGAVYQWGDLSDRLLAVVGNTGVTVFDLSGDKPVEKATLPGSYNRVRWSPDGKRLAFCLTSQAHLSVASWDGKFGTLRTINLSEAAYSLDFTADGKRLAVGTYDGDVQIWNVAAPIPKLLSPRPSSHGPIRSVSYGGGGRLLASCDRLTTRVWERTESTFRVKWAFATEDVRSVALSADGKTLVTSDAKSSTMWDLGGTAPVKGDTALQVSAEGVRFSADGKLLAGMGTAGGKDGVQVWEVTGSKRKLKWFVPAPAQVPAAYYHFGFAAGGRFVAVQSWIAKTDKHETEVWELAAPEPKRVASFEMESDMRAISPDGKVILGSNPFWKWEEGKPARRAVTGISQVFGVFTGDGKRLLSCEGFGLNVLAVPADDAFLAVGEAAKKVMKKVIPRPDRAWTWPGRPHALAISPDDKEFAVGNGNGTIWIMRLDP